MSDYNDGIIPEPCLRLDYGSGQDYLSIELGDGTGYVRVTDDLRVEHRRMQLWYDEVLRAALAENAKLRGLVRLMVRRHTPISPCKSIPCGECPVKDECDQEDALMRELGIEVDA